MKRLPFLLLFFIPAALQAQNAQQRFLDSLAGNFVSEIRRQEKPKAFGVTDKSVYKAGDNIWFRGYLLNQVSQKITSRSKYFFVDLVNAKDSVISYALLDASIQQLNAKIILPPEMPSGYYWLRAYTRQMAENDTNNIFVKPIYIIGQKGRPAPGMNVKKMVSESQDPIVQFFPEGGSIITGANSTIALLIGDAKGKPIAADIIIKDSRDSVAARFTTGKDGLGKFSLSASSYRKYKAVINWNGKEISYPLPSFNLYAGQISLTRQPGGSNTLRVLLEDSIYKKDVVTYLLGISRDSLCFAAVGQGQYEIAVPDQKFPEGIAAFFLFDEHGKLLSERSMYVKGSSILINASVDKPRYTKREKVTMSLSVTDANLQPVAALLSVSVTDTAFANPGTESLFTYFANPASIDNASLAQLPDMTDEYLDMVMFLKTHTWNNKNIRTLKTSNSFDDSLLFIKGIALDQKDEPAAKKVLTLVANIGNASFLIDTTDNAGQFSFPVYEYADSTQFAIETRDLNARAENIKIVRDPLSFPMLATPASLKHYFSSEPVFTGKYRNAYLDTSIITIGNEILQDVTVSGKKKANYNESHRVSPASTIISSDQLDERTTVGNTLLKVGGLHMLQGFLVINGLTAMKAPDANSEPLLLVDGTQTSTGGNQGESPVMSFLNSINPKDIDFIEILKGAEGATYGMRGGNGVILLNMASTRKDNFNRNAGNVQTFYARGVSKASLFPVVNYDYRDNRSSQNFDNRSAIYWNGNVLTGTAQPFTATFFTSDVPTSYKVTITGVTVRGEFVYKTLLFDSK